MKKSIEILKLLGLIVLWFFPTIHSEAQTASASAGTPQKKEQKVKILINEDGKTVEKEMTIMADSAYHQLGDDLHQKSVTVTVTDDKNGAGESSTYTYTIGDTLQNDVARKVVRLGDGKKMIIMDSGNGVSFDTPAPRHGTAFIIKNHPLSDPYAFDPNDPNIISYQKKDKGKDLEKITIVRKKAVEPKEEK